MPSDDFCYLTTHGRVSGKPHEIEIWYVRDGDTLYMLSGGRDESDWVRNIARTPAVTVRIGDEVFEATGRVLDTPTDESERARSLVFEKYTPRYSGDLTEWRGRSLPVALDLHV